ncbi:MAG: internalin [Thermotogaceae bacterium]|nr:internalin [Thermotogaceae bacterium]
MKTLDLQTNQITDNSPLQNLLNLEQINLIENEVIDLSPLSNMTELKWLTMYNNFVSDLNPLTTLLNLERIEAETIKSQTSPPLFKDLSTAWKQSISKIIFLILLKDQKI